MKLPVPYIHYIRHIPTGNLVRRPYTKVGTAKGVATRMNRYHPGTYEVVRFVVMATPELVK